MAGEVSGAIGLVLRSGPYQQRAARSQLDVALVAAALDQPLRLYFLGYSVLQLIGAREPGAAGLPPGYRGWASLPGLTRITAFADTGWFDWLLENGTGSVLALEPATRQQMQADWRACHRVLVL
ncbi:MAG TPA: hypothetical protein VI566_02935 [Xanthomonadales bacterium]|nr:hypothetical protein [Xanthomonadales bacterium]